MSCQHKWIKSNRAYEDYICSECEMSLTAHEYEALQQAHRQGWEQCQRAVDSLLLDLIDVTLESKLVLQSARKRIASMEYKEAEHDR